MIMYPAETRSAVTVPFTIVPRFLSTDTWIVPPPRSSTAPLPISSLMSPPKDHVKTLVPPSASRSVARRVEEFVTAPAPESAAISW